VTRVELGPLEGDARRVMIEWLEPFVYVNVDPQLRRVEEPGDFRRMGGTRLGVSTSHMLAEYRPIASASPRAGRLSDTFFSSLTLIEVERYGRRPVANLNAPSAESSRARGGLVRITTVLSRSDRGAEKKWRRQ
jgi:hypothetical protein